MDVDTKKKPNSKKPIEAKATLVIMFPVFAYRSIIQTPNHVPNATDTIPGIPRNGRGLSSTISLIKTL